MIDIKSLSYFTYETDRGRQSASWTGLDGCAFFKKGEWQLLLALFFQTLFVSPSVGLLSRKLHRRSNNILLSRCRRRPLLLYLGAVAKVALQQLRQIYCFMLVIFPRKRLVEPEWRTEREREGERPKGADLMEEGYRPRKFGCFVPK